MVKVSTEQLNQCSTLTVRTSRSACFTQVSAPQFANESSLVFISTPQMLAQAKLGSPGGLILHERLLTTTELPSHIPLWSTSNIQKSMTEVLRLFDPRPPASIVIHPLAAISPTARLGKNISIAAGVIVADGVTIEDDVVLGPNCVVEYGAYIKKGSVLQANVYVGAFCEVGQRCHISPHVVIGSDGFGYATDVNGVHTKIPQIGTVIIGDDVDIGSHCAIDRATLAATRIGSGSKLDNFCHIAHNCELGSNGIFAAGFMVAGSAIIGRNVMAGGGVQVIGHTNIADNVTLTGRAGVVSSIDKPGVYGGFPHVPQKENLRILTSLKSLPKIRKQLNLVLKHLGLSYKEDIQGE
jgi:UDP-3-O-[3-hydroxymyristoyl] glucosamine N-acyltransferase